MPSTAAWAASGLAVLASACGQSADVIGGRNDLPPEPEDTAWVTDFEACATEREEAALLPTSLFFAVDKSGSMNDPLDGRTTGTTTGTTTKWDAATGAFTTFFSSPSASTLDVALRLWPDADGCDDTVCDAVACSDPQVPLGSVGDLVQQQALIDAFTTTVPGASGTGTPMFAALDGAGRWAAAHVAEAAGDQVAIVFVTDGLPNGCDDDIADIAALAAASSAAGVPVYVVGIEGSQVAQIDQIAAAGGTVAGYFVGSLNAEEALLAALEDIQAQTVSCRFDFPTESSGDPLSPDLIRVEYTGDGGELVLVDRVRDAAACVPDGGWYLDDPDAPTTITLCPSTCAEVQGIATVAIEVDVGCECVTDDDCPGDQVCGDEGCLPACEGPACSQSSVVPIVGAVAVQGGAWSCATTPGSGGWTWLLAAAFAARVRRVND